MRISGRHVAVLAVLSLAAGGVAANAEGQSKPAKRPTRAPLECGKTTDAKPPSKDLLFAFGILSRERTAADELPAEALTALRRRGMTPVDPQSARLLRTTREGGKAWVVPVPAVAPAAPFFCGLRGGRIAVPALPAPVPASPPAPSPAAPPATRPAPPRTAPAPTRARRRAAARARTRRALPLRLAPPVAYAGGPGQPREGLAVVAVGGAPNGGGGALKELIRGLAPVAVDPCAGPNRSMQAISGIVPNGVDHVFLTAIDGTAVRTDVKDNGFAFVVARPKQPGARFVTWTGGDGTPHVMPVAEGFRVRAGCRKLPERVAKLPVVTPGPVLCVPFVVTPRDRRAFPPAACGAPDLPAPAPMPMPAPTAPAVPVP